MLNSHARLCGSLIRRPCAGAIAFRARAIFAAALSPAKRILCGGDGAERRGRPVRPDRVDRVRVDRNQPGPGLLAGRRESRDGVGRVKARVVAELVAALEPARDPFARRLLRDMTEFEHRRVGFRLHLLRIAAVDEQGGCVLEHHGEPGGARESGQPSQPLGVRGHVFVLVLVRARNDEPRETGPSQFRPQLADARGAVRRIAQRDEGLKTTLKHAWRFPHRRRRRRPAR